VLICGLIFKAVGHENYFATVDENTFSLYTPHPTPYTLFSSQVELNNPARFDKDGWVIYTLTNLAA
jgi:hypothetical protein